MAADRPESGTLSSVRIAALGADILDAATISRRLAAQAVSSVRVQSDRTAGVLDGLSRIADAAQAMTEVALQTRLLAFNLSVEAARPESDTGSLGLMARAVTDLSSRVEAASRQIVDTARRFERHLAADSVSLQPGQPAEAGALPALTGLQESLDRILASASELRGPR
ncbi:MAG: hypothetical protein KGQ67_11650 [Betaproteobacteria bacterium]|nr:hypothetical protein [Betaproteobacteria bacterium]